MVPYVDLKQLTSLVLKELKNLKGNDRLDISNIKNGEVLAMAASKPRIDMNDMRWHGAGDTVEAGDNITIATVEGKKVISSMSSGGVTSVTASAPLSSSGGNTPNLSTSMNTNKLIGRGGAGAGAMQEITLGANLSLSGTTLNAAGGSGSPASPDMAVQFNNSGSFGGDANFTFDTGSSSLNLKGLMNLISTTNVNLSIIGVGSEFAFSTDSGADIVIEPDAQLYLWSATDDVYTGTGATLATNATHGFLRIPRCNGTPTGVPGSSDGATMPVVYNYANNKLCVYNGGWKSVTLS